MSKVRIYELAKELDMDNKQLLAQVKEMGYDVKNHMSALEESEARRVKDLIMGTRSEVTVDERIRPNIIRRRTKVVHTEPPQEVQEIKTEVKLEVEPELKVKPEVQVEARIEPKPEIIRPEIVEEPQPAPEPVKAAKEATVEETPQGSVPAEPEAPKAALKAEAVKEEKKKEKPAPESKPAEAQETVPVQRPRKEYVRIIRRPVAVTPAQPEQRIEEKPQVEKKPDIAPVAPVKPAKPEAASEAEKKDIKKKHGKKLVEFTPEVVEKKKIVQRRKEIIEREQLYDITGEARPLRPRKFEKAAAKKKKATEITVPKQIKRRVKVDDTIMVGELAKRMGVKGNEVIKKLLQLGIIVNLNKFIDYDSAALVAAEFGFETEKATYGEAEILQSKEKREGRIMPRPPVVTIMGHVDHGKTSLLDAIRHTNVIAGEAGGITQHIGAYHVPIDDSRDVIFLDTPGHEAFTAMRARGAKVTDVVVLVVAADDGVMEQTREAVNHARAAEVPIVVAINKIDKPNANPDRVKRELAELGLIPEDWGGQTIFAEISAKQRKGINELLELILLQAEVLELKAVPDTLAKGRIIEARIDVGRGPVATVLVQEGTLKQGDPFVCGPYAGKVRAMFDDNGNRVIAAGPSMPVLVQGFSGIPMSGDEFLVVDDEKKARQVSALRLQKVREAELGQASKISLEKLFERMKEGTVKELKLVLKTDVQGSLEALSEALNKLSTAEIKINIIHGSTGAITESDIMLASASDAIVIGFNVRPHPRAQEVAEQEKVSVRNYDVIYQIIDDVRDAMFGLLEPTYEEKVIGRAEVRQVFAVSKIGTISGSFVLTGKIERGSKARLVRDGAVVYNGQISSLKRFKEDVKEVLTGYECGIGLDKFNDVKVNDIIEAYILEEIKPTL